MGITGRFLSQGPSPTGYTVIPKFWLRYELSKWMQMIDFWTVVACPRVRGHLWETPSLGILRILSAARLLECPDEARKRETWIDREREREDSDSVNRNHYKSPKSPFQRKKNTLKAIFVSYISVTWKTLRSVAQSLPVERPLSRQIQGCWGYLAEEKVAPDPEIIFLDSNDGNNSMKS